jgi:hypothetical protein
MARFHLIARPRQHCAGFVSDHGADRHLATGGGGAGFFKRDFHGGHGAFLPCRGLPVQGVRAIPFSSNPA